MTEAKDNDSLSTPAEGAPGDGRNAGRSPLAVLALVLVLLLALAAGGAAYYFWQALQDLRSDQAGLASEQELDQRVQNLISRGELERAVQSARAEASQVEQGVTALRKEVEGLGARQEDLARKLQSMDQLSASTLADWIRAEAAYLSRVAAYRARYYHDADAALAALKTADGLLARLGGDAIQSRQAIHRAIDELVAVNPVEIAPVAERIDALIRQIDIMPLNLELGQVVVETEPEASEVEGDGIMAGLERAWERFTATLGELVVVHRERQLEPLLVPEERYFLYHNLRLRLEAARLALVDRNEALYQDSLARAAEWIERYYATGEPQVDAALEAIDELRKVEVAPQVPDIAPILEPVVQEAQ